jgi:hypothetical protein
MPRSTLAVYDGKSVAGRYSPGIVIISSKSIEAPALFK